MFRLIHASTTAKTLAMPRTMPLTEDDPDIWNGFVTEVLLLLIQGTLADIMISPDFVLSQGRKASFTHIQPLIDLGDCCIVDVNVTQRRMCA